MNVPICINLGCNRKVHNKNGTTNNDGSPKMPKYRAVCHQCHKANIGQAAYPPGVIDSRGTECANINGKGKLKNGKYMGIKCPVNWNMIPDGTTGILEVDHIDGNHFNNNEENTQSLCCMCHRIKTPMNGDNNTKDNDKLARQRKINAQENKLAKVNFHKNEAHRATLFTEIDN